MPNLRKTIPIRQFSGSYRRYHQYKEPLRNDFNCRCGYCDDPDHFCNGKRGYHIEHFKPKSKFPQLDTQYNNLIYSCPYCNISKSNDWPDGNNTPDVGYIDPCDPQYDTHLERLPSGRISPKTRLGNYMYKKLKLGLKRHELIWKLEELNDLMKQIEECIDSDKYTERTSDLLSKHYELSKAYRQYYNSFIESLN